MGVFCTRGTGLVTESLWRNIAAGLAAARRGDHDTAADCLCTVDQIHDYAATRSLAAVAADGAQRILHALTDQHQQVPAGDRSPIGVGDRETTHHA